MSPPLRFVFTVQPLSRMIVLVCAFVVFAVCFPGGDIAAANEDEVGLKTAIRSLLDEPGNPRLVLDATAEAELAAFYESRDFLPVWSDEGKANAPALLLISELQRSLAHGLQPSFYEMEDLLALAGESNSMALAKLETGLSRAFVKYANDIANGHVRGGMDESQTIVEPVVYAPGELLEAATDSGRLSEFLKTLLPTDDRYVRLISKMAEFLRIKQLDAWPEIRNLGSSDNPAIDPERVRDVLFLTGDLETSDLLRAEDKNQVVRRAIARFQSRHGLEPSQRIDAPTYREMAKPINARIELIRVNLERRRWQNRDLGENHVYINIADRSVRFVRDGEKTGSAKFEVADNLVRLPTFSGMVEAVSLSDNGRLSLSIKSDNPVGLLKVQPQMKIELEGGPENHLAQLLGKDADVSALVIGEERALDEPVTAFVTYVTAWANKDGSISFREDLYKRDREIANLLDGKK